MFDTVMEFTLADGEVREFKPISLRDWSAFAQTIAKRRGCHVADIDFDSMMRAAQSLDGMTWLAHRALGDPSVSRDRVLDLIGSLERLAEIALAVMATPKQEAGSDPPAAEEESTT